MDPLTIIGAASAAIALLEKLIPWIGNMTSKGEITIEQQQEIKDRLAALRTDAGWDGPEWDQSGK